MEPSDFEKEKIERLRRAMYSRQLSDKLTERPRRDLDETEPTVGEDWVAEETKLAGIRVAPRFIGATRAVLWWALIASVVFFTGAVLFFMYYFTFGGGSNPASPGNIDIVITGPTQVMGGEPTELQIVVTNRNRVPLELADLVVSFPPGTRSVSDFATDLPSLRQPLGTIEPGGRRQGTISAVFASPAGERQDVKVELEYRVAGSNAIFISPQNYTLAFASSPITISVEGNREIISGQPLQFTTTIASNTGAPVKDVLVAIDFPFGFKFTSADPRPAGGNVWAIGDLAPGERKTVQIQGSLSGETGDNRVFRVTAGTRKTTQGTAIETKLGDLAYTVEVSRPFLGLTVNVNKETGAGSVVAPGENVIVTVAYENFLATDITDAIIVARITGMQIDGATVLSSDGFYRSTDGTMLWDKSTTNGSLARLTPGEKGTVSFSFQAPSSDALRNITNPHIDISVNAAGKRLSESGVPQSLQSAAQKSVKLATDLALAVQGLYYANPFGSSGPMPPKAGTETTYALVFTVTNTTNRITNAKMTARLPSYVRYVGICSPRSECDPETQKLVFNQLDGSVTWNLGDIEPGVGLNGKEPRQVAFAVGFTPSTSQIGQAPPLLQDIKLTGTDSATGAPVTKSPQNITTNISGDPGFNAADATVVR
ncbi:MAG TPA: hypothetical protein VJH91_03340 [Candidatus Paceibacterota bacterium]